VNKLVKEVENSEDRGFTLIELLIVIFIGLMLITLGLSSFSTFRKSNSLLTSHSIVISALTEARSLTLFSTNASVYGVHFASTSITRFTGTSYNPLAGDNVVYSLETGSVVGHLGLSPFTYNVTFQRLTGQPSATGTIELQLGQDASMKNNVILDQTGIAH